MISLDPKRMDNWFLVRMISRLAGNLASPPIKQPGNILALSWSPSVTSKPQPFGGLFIHIRRNSLPTTFTHRRKLMFKLDLTRHPQRCALFCGIVLSSMCVNAPAFAQSGSSDPDFEGNAGAVIINGLRVIKRQDLDFGAVSYTHLTLPTKA